MFSYILLVRTLPKDPASGIEIEKEKKAKKVKGIYRDYIPKMKNKKKDENRSVAPRVPTHHISHVIRRPHTFFCPAANHRPLRCGPSEGNDSILLRNQSSAGA